MGCIWAHWGTQNPCKGDDRVLIGRLLCKAFAYPNVSKRTPDQLQMEPQRATTSSLSLAESEQHCA